MESVFFSDNSLIGPDTRDLMVKSLDYCVDLYHEYSQEAVMCESKAVRELWEIGRKVWGKRSMGVDG